MIFEFYLKGTAWTRVLNLPIWFGPLYLKEKEKIPFFTIFIKSWELHNKNTLGLWLNESHVISLIMIKRGLCVMP